MESKKLMKVGSIVVVVLMIVGWLVSSYNSMVSNQEEVTTAWSNVEAAYQRRADMMPQLAKIVKSYAKHERETFEQVTKARNAATQIHLDAADLTPEKIKAFEQAQNQVTQALSRLIAVSERYPDLKASENYKSLMVQEEGTEPHQRGTPPLQRERAGLQPLHPPLPQQSPRRDVWLRAHDEV